MAWGTCCMLCAFIYKLYIASHNLRHFETNRFAPFLNIASIFNRNDHVFSELLSLAYSIPYD